MGCDIHLKLERKIKKPILYETPLGEIVEPTYYGGIMDQWQPIEITFDKCWSDRVYGMFARLADVRNYFDKPLEHIPLRGFPDDACNNTKSAYCLYVTSDEDYEMHNGYEYSCVRWINESRARKMLESGRSVPMIFGDGERMKITDSDWHSANWCTTDEMRQCIHDTFWNEERQVWFGDFVEWFALLGAMEGIEKGGYYECRAVFWFDN